MTNVKGTKSININPKPVEVEAKMPTCSESTLKIFAGLGKEPKAPRALQNSTSTLEGMKQRLKSAKGDRTFMTIMTCIAIAILVALTAAVAPFVPIIYLVAIPLQVAIFSAFLIGTTVARYRGVKRLERQIASTEEQGKKDLEETTAYFKKNHKSLLEAIKKEIAASKDKARLEVFQKAREELVAARDHVVKAA